MQALRVRVAFRHAAPSDPATPVLGWALPVPNVRNGTSRQPSVSYRCGMIHEGTPDKWSLWATHPKRLGGIAELFPTEAAADARATDLKRAGYKAETFLSRPGQLQRAGLVAAHPALLRHR